MSQALPNHGLQRKLRSAPPPLKPTVSYHAVVGSIQMLQEKKVNLDSVVLNYVEGPPSGPPVLLLHGIPDRWQEFLPIIPALCLRWKLYALDFRGHGKSGRVPGGYHSRFYGQDVVDFLKKNVCKPAIVFGMSAGGLVALDVAARAPERVSALVLGDSPIDMDWLVAWMTSAEFRALFSAFRALAASKLSISEIASELAQLPISVPGDREAIRYGDQPGVDAVSLRQLAITLYQLDPGVLEYHAEARAKEYLEGFDLREMLARITCPVLLLQGDPSHGGMMTSASVEYALSRLANGSHVLIEGHGHDLGLDSWEPGPVLRAVSTFLESL